MGKELFFPDGNSTKGRAEDFTFHVCDFKRNQIPIDDTVGRLYEQTKLKLLRFYICTKEEASSTDQSPSEVHEHSEDSLSEDLSVSITEGADSQSTKHGSHIDAEDLITDLLEHGYSSDSGISKQSAELYGVPMQDLQLPSSSANGLPTLHVQSIREEAEQTAQQDIGLNFLPQHSSSQLSPSTSDGSSGNPESPRRASIHRIKVVEDLLAVFMDSSIINLTLKMDFVNEKAIDDAGVSREVYTAFWEEFLEQCEGETEQVPRLRQDFCERFYVEI